MTTQTAQEKAQQALTKRKGSAITVDGRLPEVRKMLMNSEKQIKNALPKHLTPGRMIRIAYTSIQKNPTLLDCDQRSIIKSVIEASELGLEPVGPLGHAYFVPYFNSRSRQMECQLQIGYRGFIELAGRSGKIQAITSAVVYEGEEFTYEEGLEPKLVHKPNLTRDPNAKPIAVYAIAHFKDGGTAHEVLSMDEVDKRRRSSQSEQAREKGKVKETPWVTHFEAMARKTAIRALAKYLPLSPELTRAANIDEQKDDGILEGDFTVIAPDEGEENYGETT